MFCLISTGKSSLAGLDVLDDGAEHGEEEEDGVEDADELDAGGAAEEAAALARRVRQAAHCGLAAGMALSATIAGLKD